MSSTWWQRLVKSKFSGSRQARSCCQPRLRLRLESLENRLAPATHIWNGAGLSNSWSLDSNWSGGSPNGDPSAVLMFPAGASQAEGINDLDNLTLQSITISANNYQITGNPITLNGGITVDGGVTGPVTFNLNIALGASQTWTVTNAGARLTARGDLTGPTDANLTKVGAGTLVLAGNSTYLGNTTVNAGVLVISGSKALGIGSLFLNGGSTLQADETATLTNAYTVTGSVVFSTKDSLSSLSLRAKGTIDSFSSVTVANSPGDITLAGNLGGNGSLIVNPGTTGNLTVSGLNNSDLSGPVVLSSGFLTVGNNNAFGTGMLRLVGGTLRSNSAYSLNNVFSVEGPAQIGGEYNLTFSDPGTLFDGTTLTVTNRARTTFSGPDSVLTGRGALTEDGGDTGILQIFSGGTNTYKGGTTLTTGTIVVNKSSSLGDGRLTLRGGTLQASAAVTLPNPFTVLGPASIPGTPAIGGSNNITFDTPGTLTAGATLFISNTASAAVTTFLKVLDGAGGLTVASVGRAVLSVANLYTGATIVSGGTLQLGITNAIASASAVTVADGGTLDLHSFNDTIASLASPLPPFANLPPKVTLGSGTLTIGGDNTSTTFAGMISGTGGLTKIGTGTLTLTGTPATNNTYTGPTNIVAGTLVVNDSQPGSAVTVSSGATLRGGGALAKTGDITSAGGIVSPGTSTNTALRSGKLTFDSATSFVTQLINKNVVNQLLVTPPGPVSLGNSTLRATLSFSPSVGDSFTLIAGATAVTGTFNGLPEGAVLLVGGAIFKITYAGGPGMHNVMLIRSTLDTTTTLVSSANPSVFSQPVTFTATVTPAVQVPGAPTGLVAFQEGNVILDTVPVDANGHATFRTSALTLPAHTITARYRGDSNFTPSVATAVAQNVKQASSTAAVTGQPNPSVFGQPVILTAIVSPAPPATETPTGIVTFKDGTAVLGTANLNVLTGRATLTISQLAIGSHTITVDYSGDLNFMGSSSAALTEVINKISTVTILSSSASPALLGQAVTLTAIVSVVPPSTGTPSGTVTFSEGAQTLGVAALASNGQTTLSTTALTVGVHSISAVYSGDSLFAGSTSATLTQAIQATTTTVVTSSANPSVMGQPVTFTASVTTAAGAGTPTGTVTFKDGAGTLGTAVLDANARATFATPALAVGSHTITVVYRGDSSFVASTSAPLIQTVNPPLTTTALASSANPSITRLPVTFTATVTVTAPGVGIPTGTVIFRDGQITLGTTTLDSNGTATFTTDRLFVGTHTITATYGGDGNFTASASPPVVQKVLAIATNTTLSSSLNPAPVGQPVTLTATVTIVPPGKGTPSGTVNFIREGTGTLGTATLDASGQATFTTSALPAGTQGIVAAYAGDDNFGASVSGTLQQTVAGTVVGLSPNQRFVVQLYRDLLEREPEPGGLEFYSGRLDRGDSTRFQVAVVIEVSPEFRTLQVQNMYRALLGRDADAGGMGAALKFLAAGGTLEQLKTIIAGSPEYFLVRGGGTSDGFLDALFHDAFNRAVDAGGRVVFDQALAGGMTRSRVADIIYGSSEYRQDLVLSFYQRYLHRVADPIGFNASTEALRMRVRDETLVAAIVASPEYFWLV